jgi:protein involved in polysaccharide export with SLBB domain
MLVALLAASLAFGQEYHLGAGDRVQVRVFDELALSGDFIVPASCELDLQLVGAVPVCGKSPRDVGLAIEALYADGYLLRPRVEVTVIGYGSQTVEVKGAVKTQGVQVLTGPTTLSRIITMAGGPSEINVVEVDVYHADGTQQTYQISKLETMDPPVYVESGDIVNLKFGRNVYLGGRVARDGPVPYREGMTVTQALGMAGGLEETASNRAYILKKSGERIPINLRRVQQGQETDYVLEPDDQVIVRTAVF